MSRVHLPKEYSTSRCDLIKTQVEKLSQTKPTAQELVFEVLGKSQENHPKQRVEELCELLNESLTLSDFYGAATISLAIAGFLDYPKTKRVSPSLFPFFDQNGHWYGYGVYNRKGTRENRLRLSIFKEL